MRVLSYALLWANLAALGAFWCWGERTYRSCHHALFSAALDAVPIQLRSGSDVVYSYPPGETAADLKQRLEAASRRETAAYVMWRDTSLLLFATTLCAAGWVSLAPAAPGLGRTRRRMAGGSMVGAAVAAVAAVAAFGWGPTVTGMVYADEYEPVARLNAVLAGVIVGTVAGAMVGGLLAWAKRAEPVAAADRGRI